MLYGQLHAAADLWCPDFHLDTARQSDHTLQTADVQACPTTTSPTFDFNAAVY